MIESLQLTVSDRKKSQQPGSHISCVSPVLLLLYTPVQEANQKLAEKSGNCPVRFGRLPPREGIHLKSKGRAHFPCGRRSISPAACLQEPATGQLQNPRSAVRSRDFCGRFSSIAFPEMPQSSRRSDNHKSVYSAWTGFRKVSCFLLYCFTPPVILSAIALNFGQSRIYHRHFPFFDCQPPFFRNSRMLSSGLDGKWISTPGGFEFSVYQLPGE